MSSTHRGRRCSFRLIFCWLIGTLDAWLVSGVCAANEAELARILSAWERRQQATTNVKYVLEGTQTLTADWIEPGVPPADRTTPQRRVIYLDFVGNRARKEMKRDEHVVDSFRDAFSINMYDGKTFQRYEPKEHNYDMKSGRWKYDPELRTHESNAAPVLFFEAGDAPLFLAHANFKNRRSTVADYRSLRNPLDRTLYRWHSAENLDGRRCNVVRAETAADGSYFDVWAATDMDDLPVKVAHYSGEKTMIVWEMWYEREARGPVLKRFRYHRPQPSGIVSYKDELQVVAYETPAELVSDLFHLAPSAGMIVEDSNGTRVRIGEPGQPDVDVRALYAAEQRSRIRWLLWSIVLGHVLVIGSAIFAWRRYRRHSAKVS